MIIEKERTIIGIISVLKASYKDESRGKTAAPYTREIENLRWSLESAYIWSRS